MSRYRRDLTSVQFVKFDRFKGAYHDYVAEGRIQDVRESGIFHWPRWTTHSNGTYSGPHVGPEKVGKAVVIKKSDFYDICRAIRLRPEEMMDTFINLSIIDGWEDEKGQPRWIKDNMVRIDAEAFDYRINHKIKKLPPARRARKRASAD